MPIRRLLKDNGLAGPEDVERLNRAYSYALRSLHLVDRNDPITEIVAKKVIEVGAKGVRRRETALRRPVDYAQPHVRKAPRAISPVTRTKR
jgi:hypothetical protein